MAKVNILNSKLLDITLSRLSQEIIENHGDFNHSVIIGIQASGVYLADRIRKKILEFSKIEVPMGKIDITFHRDDFRSRDTLTKANATEVPFILEGKRVILIDDVLYTGRSVRAALDAMLSFGRPEQVELLCLIDRKYSRDLPIEPSYYGKAVNSIQSQRITTEWTELGFEEDRVWLESIQS